MRVTLTTAVALCAVPETHAFVSAFLQQTAGLKERAATPSLRMAAESDFVPSEVFFREKLGTMGLRYSMSKTPKEVEKEGDYSLFEAIFGQTSNNPARIALKKEVRVKTAKPSDPVGSKAWLEKYGWPRYFPAYVDRSGESEDEVPAAAAPVVLDKPTKNPVAKVAAAKPVVVKTAPKAVAKAAAAPKPVVEAAPKPVIKAPAKVVAAAKPILKAPAKAAVAAAKPVVAAAKPVVKPIIKAAAASKGNLANIPKAIKK